MNRTFDFRRYRPRLLIAGLVLVAVLPTSGVAGVSRLPDAPNLSGQVPEYLALQLRAYKSGERRHPVMNVIAKPLSDEDIDDLATWYSEIEVTVTPPQ